MFNLAICITQQMLGESNSSSQIASTTLVDGRDHSTKNSLLGSKARLKVLIDQAAKVAEAAHRGQTRREGGDYFQVHVKAVADAVLEGKANVGNEVVQAAAGSDEFVEVSEAR